MEDRLEEPAHQGKEDQSDGRHHFPASFWFIDAERADQDYDGSVWEQGKDRQQLT